MSAQSFHALRKPGTQSAIASVDREIEASFDARWTAWIERGRQRERAEERKLRVALAVFSVIAALATLAGLTAGAR